MNETEARECFADALAVECRLHAKMPGEWCPLREGTTWCLCSQRVEVGRVIAETRALARSAYLAGMAEQRERLMVDLAYPERACFVDRGPVSAAFDEWWRSR